MENLLSTFIHPSVLDIKLGTHLYDPTESLSEDKIAKMIRKAEESTSAKTGLRISGFQVSWGNGGLDNDCDLDGSLNFPRFEYPVWTDLEFFETGIRSNRP